MADWVEKHSDVLQRLAVATEVPRAIASAVGNRGIEVADLEVEVHHRPGCHRSDSEQGRSALERLGVDQSRGPVVTLYNGLILVDLATPRPWD